MVSSVRVQETPHRAPMWLLGSGHGIQVWTIDDVDPRLRVSVMVSEEPPVVLLNSDVAGTPLEGAALRWALERVANGGRGFYVWRA